MDRKSLVASLQNFRQNLLRQQYLNSSLDELRRKRAEYERQCKLSENPDKASYPPEKSTYGYERLSAYDKKHMPKEKSKKYKEFRVSFCATLLKILIYLFLVAALSVGVWLLIMKLGKIPFADALKLFADSDKRTLAIGILVITMCVMTYLIRFRVNDGNGLFEYDTFHDFFGDIFDGVYEKRLKRYFARHAVARSREYKIDLEENYEKSKKVSDETKPRLAETIALISTKSQELDAINKAVDEYDILPEKYKTVDAVEHISGYIRDMRADSIKEAINLYAYEASERSHRNRLMWEAQLQTEAMQNAADAAWRAADEQARTARAQERAADEAEKRRKAAEETLDKVKDIKDILDS